MRNRSTRKLRTNRKIVVYHGHVVEIELAIYLRDQNENLVVIEHPFIMGQSIGRDLASSAVVYKNGRAEQRFSYAAPPRVEFLFWLRDTLATFSFIRRIPGRGGVYFGVDNLSACIGIMLRRLGWVDKVVYYSLDFHPKRFRNWLLNSFYHYIDRFCCRRSDLIWVLHPGLMEARYVRGFKKEESAPVIIVPWGTHYDSIERLPLEKINRHQLIFMGGLTREKGFMLAVEAMPEIIKHVPDARLTAAGTGKQQKEAAELADRLGVSKHVEILGYIESHAELEKIMAGGAIGLAPYLPEPNNYTNFTDPAKPRNYIACGLPVIMTGVALTAAAYAAEKAGIIIEYDKASLAAAAVKLLTDDKLYAEYRENAIAMGAATEWKSILKKALADTEARWQSP